MNWKVPLTTLTLGEEEEQAVLRVLRNGWLSMGPEVEAFEKEFAEAIGTEFAVATANATDALALAYDAVGVNRGETIAMCALTFVASLNVALRRGEKVQLIDIVSEDDLTMSANDLAEKVNGETCLVVTMPYGGYAPHMNEIMDVAHRHNLPVVEDACHGLLASYHGRRIGSIGRAAVFSFFGNKNMTTGEGGMLTTNDRSIAERVRLMRNHGMTRTSRDHYAGKGVHYDVVVAGHNFRMDELRAAIGREQLRKLEDANQRRRENAAKLRSRLRDAVPDLGLPFFDRNQTESAHHLLPAILPKGTRRDRFIEVMHSHGVQTSLHYRPLHRLRHTTGMWLKPPHLPVLESIEDRLVTLPLGPAMTDEQIDLVVKGAVTALH